MGQQLYSDEQLLGYIVSLNDELGRTPSKAEFDNRESGPCSETYRLRFGSWEKAVRKAGLKPLQEYMKEDLIQYLQSLGKKLKHTPRRIDVNNAGMPKAETYARRFGSFENALKEAGFEPSPKWSRVTNEELIRHLKKLGKSLGHAPTLKELDESDGPHQSTYAERLGWNNALREAGMDPRKKPYNFIQDEKLLQDIRDVTNEMGCAPSYLEMAAKKRSSPRVMAKRFGSWNNALIRAGVGKFVKGYTDEELFTEIERVRRMIGHVPSFDEMWHMGNVAPGTYVNHFGSWKKVREAFRRHEEHEVSRIPAACKEAGLGYPTIRNIVSDLARRGSVYGNSKQELEFIRGNLAALYRRMGLGEPAGDPQLVERRATSEDKKGRETVDFCTYILSLKK